MNFFLSSNVAAATWLSMMIGGNLIGGVHGAAYTMVEVECIEEEGKENKCRGATMMATPSPLFLNGEVSYAGGYSWDYQFVNGLLDEGGVEIGETDYNIVSEFITPETLKVQITDEGQCTITVNGTETCRTCQSAEVDCFDGSNSRVQYDCTNLPGGKASLDECVPLNPTVDPILYPFELMAADEYFSYEYTVKDSGENVYRYDSELPECFREPKLIRQDSSTVPMCVYDSNFLSIQELKGSSITIKVNDIWSTTEVGLIPHSTQVFVHTNGIDSVLRNETSDNFICANTEGFDLTIQPNIGSEPFEVQCVQQTPDSPFFAAIDLVITDDIIMGSNEVGHPCYDHYEPIFQSCSYRLVLPCSQDEICPEVAAGFAAGLAAPGAEVPGDDDDDDDEELCPGKTRVETEFDLGNAVVTNNTLHIPGGKLEYDNVGTVRGKEVNLVVTVYEGEYITNEDSALLKNGKGSDENGNWGEGMFGNINLLTVYDHPKSGEASFEFCFHDKEDGNLVTVDSFQWSVYDLDERMDCKNCIKEKFIFDTRQAVDYVMTNDTEVQVFCESYTLWPHKSVDADPPSPHTNCPPGDRLVFHSSTEGVRSDNPTNKDEMTRQQLRRSVQFTFKDTSCFHFTYNHYCPPEEVGNGTPCGWYGSGNFLFAGSAAQLIEEGECITSAPTTSPVPTKNPTVSPTTSSPTLSPTKDPTVSPTVSPTAKPFSETTTPPVSPTEAPITTLPPKSVCEKDLKLTKLEGEKEIDLSRVVNIVSQDESTVTVSLTEGWVDANLVGSSGIDQIFYNYKTNLFDQKCFEETEVLPGTTFATNIEIKCLISVPYAFLELCLVDDLSHGCLTSGDDATIPKCCEPEVPPEKPTVCYTISIKCVTECVEEGLASTRRGLRGGDETEIAS